MGLFFKKNRAPHLGKYPMETVKRVDHPNTVMPSTKHHDKTAAMTPKRSAARASMGHTKETGFCLENWNFRCTRVRDPS